MHDHTHILVPHGQFTRNKYSAACFLKLNFKKQAKTQRKWRAGLRHWHFLGKKKKKFPVLSDLWKWTSCLPSWCFFRNWKKMFSTTRQKMFDDFFSALPSCFQLVLRKKKATNYKKQHLRECPVPTQLRRCTFKGYDCWKRAGRTGLS